jgi:hypothetical protein
VGRSWYGPVEAHSVGVGTRGTQGPGLGAAPNRPSFGTTNEGAIEAIPGALILSECCRDSGQIGCDPSRVTDPKHDRSLPRRPNNLG